jgi:Flp pilus assembly protein TadG
VEEKTMKVQIDSHGQVTAFNRSLKCAPKSGESHVQQRSLVRRIRALLRGGEQGSSLIEFGLIFPAFMMLLTAICTFAIAFSNELTLTSAVGSGAQYLQLIRTTTSNPCADTLSAIESAAPNLTPGSISLSFNFNGTSVSGNSCSGDQSYLVQGEPVTVSATYPCTLQIYAVRFTNACQLSAKVTEYEY